MCFRVIINGAEFCRLVTTNFLLPELRNRYCLCIAIEAHNRRKHKSYRYLSKSMTLRRKKISRREDPLWI